MANPEHFRISAYLKDILGRGLVTNEFVAVFELVKNGFDAGATRVDIEIDPEANRILISDNGKGMNREDVVARWLFLARSEKAEGTEDDNIPNDYRDRIKIPGQYAGNKGIGRLSCDTLGARLELYSRKVGAKKITRLDVDWTEFEVSSKHQFGDVQVQLRYSSEFPKPSLSKAPSEHGTVLLIQELRGDWGVEKFRRLRQYLAKLIDPFGTTDDVDVCTYLVGLDGEFSELNGPVGNDIAEVLTEKTTRIFVNISRGIIETKLVDRGTLLLHVSEPNEYPELDSATIKGEVYFLNRSAKHTFTQRMKITSVEFGSIFLFLNGFRIFPIGEQNDDTFGLNRRKQQGSSRYFGTRDVMGRVDVEAPSGLLREASSRDQGLIDDANRRALFEAIRTHMVFRLERYVVGVNWKIKEDQDREDRSAHSSQSARALAAGVLGSIAKRSGIELHHIDPDLFDIADARESSTKGALDSLQILAEESGQPELLGKVETARARIAELEAAQEKANAEARALEQARERDAARIQSLERQTRFLSASADPNGERYLLLIHQASIYSTHIDGSAEVATDKLRRLSVEIPEGEDIQLEDLEGLAATLREGFREVRADLADISLEADRLKALCRFAPSLDVEINRPDVDDDIIAFLGEYIDIVVNQSGRTPSASLEVKEGIQFDTQFSPFDIAVLVENFLDNARKASALKIEFRVTKVTKSQLQLEIRDDGVGLGFADPRRIFERGYSGSWDGTGLGLYHIRQVIEGMQGSIVLKDNPNQIRADFLIKLKGKLR